VISIPGAGTITLLDANAVASVTTGSGFGPYAGTTVTLIGSRAVATAGVAANAPLLGGTAVTAFGSDAAATAAIPGVARVTVLTTRAGGADGATLANLLGNPGQVLAALSDEASSAPGAAGAAPDVNAAAVGGVHAVTGSGTGPPTPLTGVAIILLVLGLPLIGAGLILVVASRRGRDLAGVALAND